MMVRRLSEGVRKQISPALGVNCQLFFALSPISTSRRMVPQPGARARSFVGGTAICSAMPNTAFLTLARSLPRETRKGMPRPSVLGSLQRSAR
jgi:hypothetical protein